MNDLIQQGSLSQGENHELGIMPSRMATPFNPYVNPNRLSKGVSTASNPDMGVRGESVRGTPGGPDEESEQGKEKKPLDAFTEKQVRERLDIIENMPVSELLSMWENSGNRLDASRARLIKDTSLNENEDSAKSFMYEFLRKMYGDFSMDLLPAVQKNYVESVTGESINIDGGSVLAYNLLQSHIKKSKEGAKQMEEDARAIMEALSSAPDGSARASAFSDVVGKRGNIDSRYYSAEEVKRSMDSAMNFLDENQDLLEFGIESYKEAADVEKEFASSGAVYTVGGDMEWYREKEAKARGRVKGNNAELARQISKIKDPKQRELILYAIGKQAGMQYEAEGKKSKGNPFLELSRTMTSWFEGHVDSIKGLTDMNQAAKFPSSVYIPKNMSTEDPEFYNEFSRNRRLPGKGLVKASKEQIDAYKEWVDEGNRALQTAAVVRYGAMATNSNESGVFVLDKMIYPTLQSMPTLVQAAIPYAGWVLNANMYRGMEYTSYIADGVPPDEANVAATISAPIMALVERLQWRSIAGRGFNPFRKFLLDAHRTIPRQVGKFLMAGGVEMAKQNIEEAIQDITPIMVKELLRNSASDATSYNYISTLERDIDEYAGSRMDTFWALLGLSFVGAGAAGIRDRGMMRDILNNRRSLSLFAFDEATINKILDAPTFNEQYDTFLAAYANQQHAEESVKERARLAREGLDREAATAENWWGNNRFEWLLNNFPDQGFTIENETSKTDENTQSQDNAPTSEEGGSRDVVTGEADGGVAERNETPSSTEPDARARKIPVFTQDRGDTRVEWYYHPDRDAFTSEVVSKETNKVTHSNWVSRTNAMRFFQRQNVDIDEAINKEKAIPRNEGEMLGGGGNWVVRAPDGSVVGRYDTKERAQKSASLFNNSMNLGARDSLVKLHDWINKSRRRAATLKMSKKKMNFRDLVRAGIMTRKQVRNIVDAYRGIGESVGAESQVFGANVSFKDAQGKIIEDMIAIFEGASPMTIVEEHAELFARNGINSGRFSLEDMNRWRSDIEGGWHNMTEPQATEWFGRVVQAHFLGNEQNLPIDIQGAIYGIRQYMAELEPLINRLEEMINDGSIDPRLLTTLDQASGLMVDENIDGETADETGEGPAEPEAGTAAGKSDAGNWKNRERKVLPRGRVPAEERKSEIILSNMSKKDVKKFEKFSKENREQVIDNSEKFEDTKQYGSFSPDVVDIAIKNVDEFLGAKYEHQLNAEMMREAAKLLNRVKGFAGIVTMLETRMIDGEFINDDQLFAATYIAQSVFLTQANRARSPETRTQFVEQALEMADYISNMASRAGRVLQAQRYMGGLLSQKDLPEIFVRREWRRMQAMKARANPTLTRVRDMLEKGDIRGIVNEIFDEGLMEMGFSLDSKMSIDALVSAFPKAMPKNSEAAMPSIVSVAARTMEQAGAQRTEEALRKAYPGMSDAMVNEVLSAAYNEASRETKASSKIFRSDVPTGNRKQADPRIDHRTLSKKGVKVFDGGTEVSWEEFAHLAKTRLGIKNINEATDVALTQLGFRVEKDGQEVYWADLRKIMNPRNRRAEEKIIDRIKERILNKEQDSTADVRDAINKLFAHSGANFTPADITRFFNEKMNIRDMTPKERESLEKLASALAAAPGEMTRTELGILFQQQLDKIFRRRGFVDLFQSLFITNMLTSVSTHALNIVEGFTNYNFLGVLNQIGKNPAKMVRGLSGWFIHGARAGIPIALSEARGVLAGHQQSVRMEREGTRYDLDESARFSNDSGRIRLEKKGDILSHRSALDIQEFGKLNPLRIVQLSQNFLRAQDCFWFRTTYESFCMAEALKEAEGTGEDALRNAYRILWGTDEQIKDDRSRAEGEWERMPEFAKEQLLRSDYAQKQGKDFWIDRRVHELANMRRDGKLVERATWMASRTTLNFVPEGMFGVLTNTLLKMQGSVATIPETDKTHMAAKAALSFFATRVKFLRVATNALSQYGDYAWGTFTGLLPWTLKGDFFTGVRIVEKNGGKWGWEQQLQIKKGIAGQMMLWALGYLLMPDKDEEAEMTREGERFIRIHGAGTGNWTQMRKIHGEGWKPYSVQYTRSDGSKVYIDYRRSPLVFVLGAIGSIHDYYRYTKQEDQSPLVVAQLMFDSVKLVSELHPLEDANEFIKIFTEGDLAQVKRAAITEAGSFIPAGSLFSSLNKYTDEYKRDKSSFLGYALSRLPGGNWLNKPVLNTLGLPVKNPGADFFYSDNWDAGSDEGKIFRLFASKEYYPSAHTSVKSKMEPDMYYEYLLQYGDSFRPSVMQNMQWLSRLEPKEAQKELRKLHSISRQEALSRLHRLYNYELPKKEE